MDSDGCKQWQSNRNNNIWFVFISVNRWNSKCRPWMRFIWTQLFISHRKWNHRRWFGTTGPLFDHRVALSPRQLHTLVGLISSLRIPFDECCARTTRFAPLQSVYRRLLIISVPERQRLGDTDRLSDTKQKRIFQRWLLEFGCSQCARPTECAERADTIMYTRPSIESADHERRLANKQQVIKLWHQLYCQRCWYCWLPLACCCVALMIKTVQRYVICSVYNHIYHSDTNFFEIVHYLFGFLSSGNQQFGQSQFITVWRHHILVYAGRLIYCRGPKNWKNFMEFSWWYTINLIFIQ